MWFVCGVLSVWVRGVCCVWCDGFVICMCVCDVCVFVCGVFDVLGVCLCGLCVCGECLFGSGANG